MDRTTRPQTDRTDVLRAAAVLTSFGPGTMLQTDEGEVPVEWLDTQHKLVTRDHGVQPILRITRTRLLRSDFQMHPEFAPVVMPPDAFGPSIPGHHVRLSRNSLVLYRSSRAELHYGTNEVLVPGAVLGDPMPLRRPGDSTFVYTQILMQRHELLYVEGMWVGSLFVADFNLTNSDEDRAIAAALGDQPVQAARPVLTQAEARVLVDQDLGKDQPDLLRDAPPHHS